MDPYGYGTPVALQQAAAPIQQTGNFNVSGFGVVPTIYGSLVANGDLTLEGTQDATKTSSYVILQPTGGNVGIGVTAPSTALEISTTGGVFQATRIAAASSATNFTFRKATTGTTTVASGDEIAAMNFSGYDGTGYILTGRMQAIVDGSVSTNTVPIALTFTTGTTAANRTERLRIESGGNVGIGITDPSVLLDVNGVIRSYGTSGTPRLLVGSTDESTGEGLEINYEFGGDLARITSIERGVAYRDLVFEGSSVRLLSGSGSVTQALAVDVNGNVIVGNAAIATNATNGFLYLPTCAGAPTGTPTAVTGRVACVVDTTNNRIYIYDGAWISAALA